MEHSFMVDVRHHICFPTLIHEFRFEQSLDKQKEMLPNIEHAEFI